VQYLLLIYGGMSDYDELTEDERNANRQEWFDYSNWLTDQGWMRAGDALQDVDQATSVRVRAGEQLVTDGPFAETKETLGGYYLIDVDNLDVAIEAAGKCPGAKLGTVEVRPTMDLSSPQPPQA
jgi:hypothetical protein